MSDTNDYRPAGLARWWMRSNPVSALWISLLCLAGIAWVAFRYAHGWGTVWTLLTQICVLLTFAAGPWCRYGIARGGDARLLILLPILLLLLAVGFYRHGLAQSGKTPGPGQVQTSSPSTGPSSGPAGPAVK